jgi:hypothetical protein
MAAEAMVAIKIRAFESVTIVKIPDSDTPPASLLGEDLTRYR